MWAAPLGSWLKPGILTRFPWAEYEVDPQVVSALLLTDESFNSSAWVNATVAALLESGGLIPMKGNIWGQCAWLSGESPWGVDDGSSRCWTWTTLEHLTHGAGSAVAYSARPPA